MKIRQILVLTGTLLAVSACVVGPYDPGSNTYYGGGQPYYGANQQPYYGAAQGQYYPAQYAPANDPPQQYYQPQRYVAAQPQYYNGGQAYYNGGWPVSRYDNGQGGR